MLLRFVFSEFLQLAVFILALHAECDREGEKERVVSFAFIEHDAFSLFSALMRSVAPFFSPAAAAEPSGHGQQQAPPLFHKVNFIFERLLRAVDSTLHAHLQSCQVSS